MPMRVRRTDEDELPPDVEALWFRRGFGWGFPAGVVFCIAWASGWIDGALRALFGR